MEETMTECWVTRHDHSNYVLRGDGFYISYNPRTSGYSEAFAGDVDEETALCKDETYFILNGDYRADYERLIRDGYDACKRFYDKQPMSARSSWSENGSQRRRRSSK